MSRELILECLDRLYDYINSPDDIEAIFVLESPGGYGVCICINGFKESWKQFNETSFKLMMNKPKDMQWYIGQFLSSAFKFDVGKHVYLFTVETEYLDCYMINEMIEGLYE